ncbi:MAG: hypothetical protein ACP5J8_01960, partial [Minisyncoccia bacterium]
MINFLINNKVKIFVFIFIITLVFYHSPFVLAQDSSQDSLGTKLKKALESIDPKTYNCTCENLGTMNSIGPIDPCQPICCFTTYVVPKATDLQEA